MGGQWRLRTSIRGFKNEVLRVSHFPNYSKLRTSTPPNLHFFSKKLGARCPVTTSNHPVQLQVGFHGFSQFGLVFHGSISVFKGLGWFFMGPGGFLWSFMVPGRFLWL